MNFFKSVFADDDTEPDPQSPPSNPPPESQHPEPEDQSSAPTWGFVGGILKTIATKSESVIETYRRDLEEFSSGLKSETQVLKEVATSSLEVGASKAQVSLESVGQAIDNIGSAVWKSTSLIIAPPDSDSDLDATSANANANLNSNALNSPVGRYSRFDAQLRGIQGDVNTYVEGVEDVGDFERWKSEFDLGDKSEEIGNLMRENGVIEGIYKRVVPSLVDHQGFWCRYFYRVYKLEQAESVRAKLVERANEDEELSWDVDDDEEEEEEEEEKQEEEEEEKQEEGQQQEGADNVEEKVKDEVSNEETPTPTPMPMPMPEEAKSGGNEEEEEELKKKNVDEKTPSEGSKDSDITVVSSQPCREEEEEEDLGWDEIEDLGSDDDKKGKQTEGGSGSPSNREELRKRLSVAEEDEDLSWDIEDDDEPIKKS